MAACIGTKLRYLRHHHQRSQADIAALLGVSAHSRISSIEMGRRPVDAPSLELVIAIAQLFQVPLDYLIRDTIPIDGVTDSAVQDAGVQRGKPRMLGQQVQTRRAQLHLTQTALARTLGIAQSTLANIEAGRKLPSIDMLIALADALTCRAQDLVADE